MTFTMLTREGLAILLPVLAAALAVFYWYVYRRETRHAPRLTGRRRWTLRLLRTGVALLAVLALWRPAVTWVKHEERLPVAALLVDESTSMAFPDSLSNPLIQAAPRGRRRRYDTAQTVVERLQERLTRTHRVMVFKLSDTVNLLKALPYRGRDDEPAVGREEIFEGASVPAGEYTNIGDALQDTLRDLAGDTISGVVLLSDGRQTGGTNMERAADQAADAGVPVHAVALGSEFPLTDLRIDDVVVDPEISLGDVLTFRLTVTNQVRSSLATTLALFEEGRKVNEKRLTLRRGENETTIVTIPDTTGLREFRLVLPTYRDEVDRENNQQTVHVKVVKRSLQVLLVAAKPTREYFYLVPALLRDPVVELSCYLQSADIDYVHQGNLVIERLPRSLEDWKKYDVVILFDVDPNKITTQQVAEMEHMVRTGGGLMVIAGRNHGLAKLIQVHAVKVRELLPVEIDKHLLPNYFAILDKPIDAKRTPEGRGHPIMRMDRDDGANEAVWSTFPAFYWHHPVKRLKRRSVALLREVGSRGGTDACLMAIHRYDEGAVFYSGIDSLWRWRFPFESYDYDRFWTNVIRYLGETRLRGTQQQVALSTDRTSYAPGEAVQIRLRILDPALMSQLDRQPIFASVTGLRKDVQMVPLRADPAGEMFYAGTYRARRVGSMVARARQTAPEASSEAKPLFEVAHPFQVRLQSLEARKTSADLAAMKALADRTGGMYLDYRNMADLDALLAAIPTDPQILTSERLMEVWDGLGFLMLFLVLIGSEWSLRKLWGLL